ncbi:MAG TPA: hypothetical protein VFJ19_12285 [Nocardioidaceae bacterium]|nr:hypothetical protein [Nocardioidaceae bacterium]
MKRTLIAATLLGLAPALTAGGAAAAWAESPLALAQARAASAPYHDTDSATDAGYAPFPDGVPLHECITAPDPEDGAMGYHWLKASLVDAELDPAQPEVLVYEPRTDGTLRLVATEYVVFAEAWEAAHPGTTPELFGRELAYVGAPNRYELPSFYQVHAWVWRHNPHGMFADHNPRVHCEQD